MTDDIEYEGKILNVDVEKVIQKISKLGGVRVGEYKFRRYVFDVLPARKGVWIRLRTNGETTTLTLKDIKHNGIDGTLEHEIVVSDFDEALRILKLSGLTPKGYQENRRMEFSLQQTMLSIDYWPELPPYLEIEAASKAAVEQMAQKLGYKSSQLVGDNTDKLYLQNGIDLDKVSELRFK